LKPVTKIVSGKVRLPSPPLIAIKILETVRKDTFSYRDLAYLIESDPALTARILKAANSSYYNPTSRISSIEKALALLGTHAVTNIALSFVIVSELKPAAGGIFDSTMFWRRALTAAVAAEMTAALVGMPNHDIFVIALLQDIGIMVMHSSSPHAYQQVFELKNAQMSLLEAEKRIFGFDHQEVGAELLKSWQLPEEIYSPIRNHHQCDAVSNDYQEQSAILSIADHLAAFYCGTQDVDRIRQAKRIFDTHFGLTGTKVENLIEAVGSRSLDVLSSFEISAGDMRPFSLILQEANEQLSNLYDSYELQVIELKQAREKAEKLAQELHEANDMHRELAFRDGLTGIYNRRFFQEALDLELMRAQRYDRQFSLIIFDVDNFKCINDAYGHTSGDLVLINISKTVHEILRMTDIFARYGGDEFVVIIPETGIDKASIVAENLRSRIEALTTTVDGRSIEATISIGLTSYSSTLSSTSKEDIISMADEALYIAKHSGKNSSRALPFPGK
jgi:two-component system, cell cycle response regulator